MKRHVKRLMRFLSESDIVRLGRSPSDNIKIGDRKYYTTATSPGIIGDVKGEMGGARVIKGDMSKKRYLWTMNRASGYVTCWRHSDGEEKASGSEGHFSGEIKKLDKEGTLNRVTNKEQRAVERWMMKQSDQVMRDMSRSIEASKKDIEKKLDKMLLDRVNKNIKPEFGKMMTPIRAGVSPLGFKPYVEAEPGSKEWIRMAASFVLSKLWNKYMAPEVIAVAMKANGLDVDEMDPQDFHFAIDDLYYKTAQRMLPRR